MSKLLKLKKWLTIEEAARHLSILFGEDVRAADVLRLGLDSELKLSVNFVNHAKAKKQKIIPVSEAETVPSLDGKRRIVLGNYWTENEVMVSDGDAIVSIGGICDLPMIGGETLDVEHAFQQLTGGPEITLTCLDGTLVCDGDGVYWKLQDSFEPREETLPDGTTKKVSRSYYPAGGLPADSVLVVRTAALQVLAEPEKEPISDKPLSARERVTLLTIVGVMLELIQSHKPGRDSEAAVIKEMLQNYEEKPGISKRNLEQKFAEAKRVLGV